MHAMCPTTRLVELTLPLFDLGGPGSSRSYLAFDLGQQSPTVDSLPLDACAMRTSCINHMLLELDYCIHGARWTMC
jgi:hypothetical protein